MKPEDILNAMAEIDEEFIEEADALRKREFLEGDAVKKSAAQEESEGKGERTDEGKKITDIRARRRPAWRTWGVLAACLVLVVIGGSVFALTRRHAGNTASSGATAEAEYATAAEEEYLDEAVAQEASTEGAAEEIAATEEGFPAEAEKTEDAADGEVAPESTEATAGAAEEIAEAAATEAATEEAAEESVDVAAVEAAEEAPEAENGSGGTVFGAQSEEPAAGADSGNLTDAAAIDARQIRIAAGETQIVFALNDSPAARSLYEQLPLTVEIENYSNNEKIFYVPEALDATDAIEGGGSAGALGYFSPWGNVVLYYGDFSAYPGLYLLGEAIEGAEHISEISGFITISAE